MRAEWEKPLANKQSPGFIKKPYTLPSFTNEFLQVPLVDALIAALPSLGLLSEDGQGSIRDNLDKKAEFALKKACEAIAVSIRANSAIALISRASDVWAQKLIQLLPENSKHLLEGWNRLFKAVSFSADVVLDSMIFFFRVITSASAARWTLWLRVWTADYLSTTIVTAYPFQGGHLLGDALDKILLETRNKKTFPKCIKWNDKMLF